MKVRERIFGAVVMSVIVRINRLSLKTGDRVKFLDGCGTQTSQGSEDSALDFCDLGIFNGIHKGVLCLRRMILQLFGCVFFAERRNLVEVHLKVMSHLFCQLILWGLCGNRDEHSKNIGGSKLHSGGGACEISSLKI